MATKKQATSFRLTPEALSLIRELSEKMGVSQASVIEMAVRILGERENGK